MSDTNQQLSFTELRELATLNTLPAILMAPDLAEKRKELTARQDAARATTAALPLAKGLNRNTRRNHGMASQASKNAVDLADLSVQEQVVIRRMKEEQPAYKRSTQLLANVGILADHKGMQKGGILPSEKMSASAIHLFAQVDEYTHTKIHAAAKSVSRAEALHKVISFGMFPDQRKLDKSDKSKELERIKTCHKTVSAFIHNVHYAGYAWTVCSYDRANKNKEDCVQRGAKNVGQSTMSVLAADIDNKEGTLTKDAMQRFADEDGGFFMETASSTPEKFKCRYIRLLETPIPAVNYKAAMSYFTTELYAKLGIMDDVACHDIARLFYGALASNIYIPETLKLFTFDTALLQAAHDYRRANTATQVYLQTVGDYSIKFDGLDHCFAELAKLGFAQRQKGANQHPVYMKILFALGDAVTTGMIDRDEAEQLWQKHFNDDNTESLMNLWNRALSDENTSDRITVRSLSIVLKEQLGDAYRNIYDIEHKPLPYNLNPGGKTPDFTYDWDQDLNTQEVTGRAAHNPEIGTPQIDISSAGTGKTHQLIHHLNTPGHVRSLLDAHDMDAVVVGVSSLAADAVKPILALPNCLEANGRHTLQSRESTNAKWSVPTEHSSQAEHDFIRKNFRNRDLVRATNDPNNLVMKTMREAGAYIDGLAATVHSTLPRLAKSTYETQQSAIHRKQHDDAFLAMTTAKIPSYLAKCWADDAQFRMALIVDEMRAFVAMLSNDSPITQAGFNKLSVLRTPFITLMLLAMNAWFDHLTAATKDGKRFPPATIGAFVKWATQHYPDTLDALKTDTTALPLLLEIANKMNGDRLDEWNEKHPDARKYNYYYDSIHGDLARMMIDTRPIALLTSIKEYLVTGREIAETTYTAAKTKVVKNEEGKPETRELDPAKWTLTVASFDYDRFNKQCSLRVLAANESPANLERIFGGTVETIAHQNGCSNAHYHNVNYTNVTATGLTSDTIPQHTLNIIELYVTINKTEILCCPQRHVAQIQALPAVQKFGVQVTYHGSTSMIGSNEHEGKHNMMIVGLPVPNIGSIIANMTVWYRRSPSQQEVHDYIHNETEIALQQAIGRLRSIRHQDQQFNVCLVMPPAATFIAPVNADPDISEDSDQVVLRLVADGIRNTKNFTLARMKDLIEEIHRDGDGHQLSVVDLADLLNCSGSTIRRSLSYGGYNSLKELYVAVTTIFEGEVHRSAKYEKAAADLLEILHDIREDRQADNTHMLHELIYLSKCTWGDVCPLETQALFHDFFTEAERDQLKTDLLDSADSFRYTAEEYQWKLANDMMLNMTPEKLQAMCPGIPIG